MTPETWLNEYDDGSVSVWSADNMLGDGPTLEAALIEAEKTARAVLEDIQARLHAEREQQKVTGD